MRRGTPATETGQTRARVGARGRRSSLPPPAALATPPGPLQAPRHPGLLILREPRATARAQASKQKKREPPGPPGPRVPSRARRGGRGVGARAPASAAVTPSSPRGPRTPTQPPLTIDVPQSQLVAQFRQGVHGLRTAQLATLVHRPAWRRVPREVRLRETRRRCRRHRP